jgi:myo-inositol catabolism protein IolC
VAYRTPEALYLLPCDHRDILADLYSTYQPSGFPDRHSWIAAAKEVVLDGLLRAVRFGVARSSAAILVDDEYGLSVLRRAAENGIARFLPIDTGEVGPFRLAHGKAFPGFAEAIDPEVVSALISYHPGATDAGNQRNRIQPVFDWLATRPRPFMLELQVLPQPGDLRSGGQAAWEATTRPGLICDAVRDLVAAGANPQIWKLQACPHDQDYRMIIDACRERRPDTDVVILGAGAQTPTVDAWLRGAATVDGVVGFAIGRSVWAEPIRALACGQLTRDVAVERISDAYLHFADTFTNAKDGYGLESRDSHSPGPWS